MCSTLFLIVHLLKSPEKALSGQSFEKDGKTTSKFLNRSWDQQQFSPSADEARVGKKGSMFPVSTCVACEQLK